MKGAGRGVLPGGAVPESEAGEPAGHPFPRHSRPERVADAAVHAVGLALALAAIPALFAAATPASGLPLLAGLGLYAFGLLAMLGCSALYNLSTDPARKGLYQRLDHAAIFLMIAGTYTPFALVAIGGAWGAGLLGFVWTAALAGAAVELTGLRRPDALMTAAYLLLGWTILAAFGPLSRAVSGTGLALLVAGGVLYSVGVVFHHWRGLRYQNAIWHAFVVLAAGCHYAAVLREVAAA